MILVRNPDSIEVPGAARSAITASARPASPPSPSCSEAHLAPHDRETPGVHKHFRHEVAGAVGARHGRAIGARFVARSTRSPDESRGNIRRLANVSEDSQIGPTTS